MAKRIGILGGIGPASTGEYYQRLIDSYYQRRGDYYYPEIIIYSLDFQRFTDYENSDRPRYIAEIVHGVQALERAGADFVAFAANSPHSVFAEVSAETTVPLLSIVEVTAQEAVRRDLSCALLLGIQHTMQSSFYQAEFEKHGIPVITPDQTEQQEINRIIFDELTLHQFKPATKQWLIDTILRYEVDGVILGCTELPLILAQKDLPIGVLDTLGLHVNAILDEALTDDG